MVRPLSAGTLAVTAAVLVSVERGATHAGLTRALGISIPRVEQHLATGRALLAGRSRDRLDDDAVLPLGQASRSIGVTPDVLNQRIARGAVRVAPRSNGVGLPVDEVRRLRRDLLLELLARHLDQTKSRALLS